VEDPGAVRVACRFVDGVQVGQNRLGKLWDLVADALEKSD
jgi:hypothetical protein